jgi:hypothetical protein
MTIHPNRLMQASVVSIQRACNPAVARRQQYRRRRSAAIAGSQVSDARQRKAKPAFRRFP